MYLAASLSSLAHQTFGPEGEDHDDKREGEGLSVIGVASRKEGIDHDRDESECVAADDGPDEAVHPAEHRCHEGYDQGLKANSGRYRAGSAEPEERDDPGEEAADREGGADDQVRRDAEHTRHPEILGGGAQRDAQEG